MEKVNKIFIQTTMMRANWVLAGGVVTKDLVSALVKTITHIVRVANMKQQVLEKEVEELKATISRLEKAYQEKSLEAALLSSQIAGLRFRLSGDDQASIIRGETNGKAN